MLLTTHGTRAVDPVCDVTIVLFSVAKWTGGLSSGGNEAANSFRSSAVSESASGINQPTNYLKHFDLYEKCFLDIFNAQKRLYFVLDVFPDWTAAIR